MCSARSHVELMAEPALAGTRLLAVTLPGHAGAPPPEDFSVEGYARITTELANCAGVDVVVGFSMGATVAYEMVVSGAFTGPVVMLGSSFSTGGRAPFPPSHRPPGTDPGDAALCRGQEGCRGYGEARGRAGGAAGAAPGRLPAEQHR